MTSMPSKTFWVKFLLVAAVENAVLYGAQTYFLWPTIVRASIGIGVAVLGLFFLGGGAGGSYLLEQADARAVSHDDVKQYVSDQARSLGLGARMILLGATIFAVTLVIP